jgi:arylsulfatase A-like enzyme
MLSFRPSFLLVILPLVGCAKQRPKPNVLLIVVDTLRADHVGPQGDRPSLTPRLDEFARDCVVFDHAQSPRAKTTPAVASLMTGLYPHDHGVRDLTTPLGGHVPVWAEAFKTGGYRTGAIVGNYVLQKQLSGLDRGFDLWVEDLPGENGVPPSHVAMRGATSMTDGVLCALGLGEPSADGAGPRKTFARPGQPWFLWAHYMDPHGAYEPPAIHADRALANLSGVPDPVPRGEQPAGAQHKRWVAEYNIPERARMADGSIDAAVMGALYGAEVSYVDEQIGRLLDSLRSSGQLENTVVIVTADHGESLGEHEYWFEHGRYAYEATCRVPLMIRFPESLEKNRPISGVRHGDISLADLQATLTESLWLPRGRPLGSNFSYLRGRSRAGLLREDRMNGPAVYSEKVERAEKTHTVQAKAARLGDWKLIRRYTHVLDEERPGGERKLVTLSEELYNLQADPAEAKNLIKAPPSAAPLQKLKDALLEFAAADEHFAELSRLLQQRREELGRDDPETLRALRALGY